MKKSPNKWTTWHYDVIWPDFIALFYFWSLNESNEWMMQITGYLQWDRRITYFFNYTKMWQLIVNEFTNFVPENVKESLR